MKQILLDTRIFVGGADLSGSGNKIELEEAIEDKAVTNWRSGGAREVIGGLIEVDISAEGQWEAGSAGLPDDAFWAQRRTLDPWTMAPTGTSDLAPGNLIYLTKALGTKRQLLGAVTEVASYSTTAKGTWPLVRGQSAHASGVPRTATGNGTAIQLGVVPAGKQLYANLHVLSVAGTAVPTITVKVQSDDNSGFTTPTDRLAFAAATAVSGEALRAPGAITDDWWRVQWTITGTTPSFLFLAAFGIE